MSLLARKQVWAACKALTLGSLVLAFAECKHSSEPSADGGDAAAVVQPDAAPPGSIDLADDGANALAPTIQSFVATPATIAAGGMSTLSWSVSGDDVTLTISIVGAVTGTSVVVTPATTLEYELTATNASGSATATTKVTVTGVTAPRFDVDMVDEESLVPFTSWADVTKGPYNAIGDGKTDTTKQLQAALDDISTGKVQVVYLPHGTYLISQTLNIVGSNSTHPFGLGASGVIGEDPATTTIKWNSTAALPMLVQNGGVGYRYNRLTWDGSGKAQYGVAHWWNSMGGSQYGGSFEHQDEVFENMGIGIMGGRNSTGYGQLDSEGQVRRVRFSNCTTAGLSVGSYNALDWWISESQFDNCAVGVSNAYTADANGNITTANAAGAMYVYRSNFNGSKTADVLIGNNQWYSLHDNVSTNSTMFISTGAINENASPMIVENNRVVGSAATPIHFGSAGPLILIDNEIQATKSAYEVTTADVDIVAVGNKWTADGVPGGSSRVNNVGNSMVAASSISAMPITLPSTPARVAHKVFEVSPTATVSDIQATINLALADPDPQPIVHFAKGAWTIGTTLTIPAHSKVQLVGDGYQSIVKWAPSTGGPMLKIGGPSKVTVRDMVWQSVTAVVAMEVDGADQSGGRVLFVGTKNHSLTASNLTQTSLSMRDHPQLTSLSLDNVQNAVSVGAGPLGEVTLANASSYIMVDSWYEGAPEPNSYFNIPNGTFTYLGGHFSPASHGSMTDEQTVMPLLVDASSANASWIGMQCDFQLVAVPGFDPGVGAQVGDLDAAAHINFMGNALYIGADKMWFAHTGTGGTLGFNLNRAGVSAPAAYPNQGDDSDATVLDTFAQARSLVWDLAPYVPPVGVTDIHFYRLKTDNSGGFVINGK